MYYKYHFYKKKDYKKSGFRVIAIEPEIKSQQQKRVIKMSKGLSELTIPGLCCLPLRSVYSLTNGSDAYFGTVCFRVLNEYVEVCKTTIFMDDAMAAAFPPTAGMAFVERMILEGWDGFVVRDGRHYKRVVLRMEKDGVCRFPVHCGGRGAQGRGPEEARGEGRCSEEAQARGGRADSVDI